MLNDYKLNDYKVILERHNNDSIAVDVDSEEFKKAKQSDRIPLWVADMSIPISPSITSELENRLKHPIYGYFTPSNEYYNAIIKWHKDSFNEEISKAEIGYENGVLGGINSALHILNKKSTPVLAHSPTYNGFMEVFKSNGYKVVLSKLILDENNRPVMDLKDMEEKIKSFKISTVLLSSPHNPSGRVWTEDELKKASELFKKYNVKVISDEIWADLTLFNNKHVPFHCVSDYARKNTITFYAPSKTFNIAGIIGSYSVVHNSELRNKLKKYEEKCFYNHMNVLSEHALIGAFSDDGREYLKKIKNILEENVNLAYSFFSSIKGVSVFKPEGTYIISVDFSKWAENNNTTVSKLVERGIEKGIMWRDGKYYNMPSCIRICLGLPTSLLNEVINRVKAILNETF